MSVRQRVLRSAPILAFALAIVFLGLSLAGYDPADPPGWGADPLNQPPANPCGPVGALLRPHPVHHVSAGRRGLLLLGLAVVNILLSPAAARFPTGSGRRRLRARRGRDRRAHSQARFPGLTPSPPVGSGGYLGAPRGDLPRSAFRPGRHDPHPRRDRTLRPGTLS